MENSQVKLSSLEVFIAIYVGGTRRYTSIKQGFVDRAGRRNDWSADVEGTAGEIALAKFLNVYWTPTNMTFSLPDLGKIEIKTSTRGDEYPVYPKMPDDQIVVMVGGSIPNFTIAGWIRAGEAKQKYDLRVKKKGYAPAHWVQPGDLKPIDIRLLRGECAKV